MNQHGFHQLKPLAYRTGLSAGQNNKTRVLLHITKNNLEAFMNPLTQIQYTCDYLAIYPL